MRTAKELLIASKEFASECRWLSWWHLWSTFGVLVGLVAITVSGLPWGIRAASSIVAGLVCVSNSGVPKREDLSASKAFEVAKRWTATYTQ